MVVFSSMCLPVLLVCGGQGEIICAVATSMIKSPRASHSDIFLRSLLSQPRRRSVVRIVMPVCWNSADMGRITFESNALN